MNQILIATQGTSDIWLFSGKDGTIVLTNHAGGTWTLQVEAPDATWIDTDVTFTDNGIKADFVTTPGLRYRLNGGDAGATAWASVILPGA